MMSGHPESQAFQGSVKAQLYPLTPLEHQLERLVECLPRRLLALQLRPKPGVPMTPVNQVAGEFLTETECPLFQLEAALAGGGWFYLEAALGRSNGSREAFLWPRGRAGAMAPIPVPSNLRGSVREVFYLSSDVQALDFQPTAAKGFFSIAGFEIHRISPVEAYLRQAHRVVMDGLDGRLERLPVHRWAGALVQRALLHDCYLETARMRLLRVRRNDYTTYLAAQQRARADAKARQTRADAGLVVSVVILPGGDAHQVAQTLASLEAQYHRNWEALLCTTEAGDETTPVPIHDPRIRRLGAMEFTAALEQVRGDWLTLLAPGSCLAPECLGALAERAAQGKYWVIYADHDRMGSEGARHAPVFKPAWNPELHLSDDYMGEACFFWREALAVRPGWRALLAMAPTPGLALRLALLDDIAPARVAHLPQVLFHHPVSMLGPGEEARVRLPVMRAFMAGRAEVLGVPGWPGLHLAYPVPASAPLVSIIIPTRNRLELLRPCVESLLRLTEYRRFELVIADNQSSDADVLSYMQALESRGEARIVRCNFPFNFSRINNEAVAAAAGDVLVFLNNDTEVVEPGWLSEMLAHAVRPEIGVVGCRLLYGNGLIQHAGVIVGLGGAAGHWFRYLEAGQGGYAGRALLTQNLSALTGACIAMRRTVFEAVGGFDPEFAVAYNDVDLCLRVGAEGYRNVYTPHAVLLHHESISRGRDDSPEKKRIFSREYARFRHRWAELLARGDPAYSPNLNLEDEGCNFARTFKF